MLGTGWGAVALLSNIDPFKYEVICISPRSAATQAPLGCSCSCGGAVASARARGLMRGRDRRNHFVMTPLLPSVTVGTVEPRTVTIHPRLCLHFPALCRLLRRSRLQAPPPTPARASRRRHSLWCVLCRLSSRSATSARTCASSRRSARLSTPRRRRPPSRRCRRSRPRAPSRTVSARPSPRSQRIDIPWGLRDGGRASRNWPCCSVERNAGERGRLGSGSG